ncbi:MAG: tyrosine-type recombinase/integrase [Shimia sp.]|nr:tyrosine-type recombinase/integrase [Shimia sp.]
MNLHNVIEAYIAFKRSLGVRLESEAGVLRAFCRSMGEIEIESVQPEAVLAFIAGQGPITRNWKQKASVLRSFYRYAVGRGFVLSAPLPTMTPKFPPTRVAHIYSTEELKRLLAATAILDTPRAPLRALGYRTLLLLLYGTGLRLNEALSLTLNDVDLANRLLTVRNTKFFKTHLVPTGPKLTRALAHYAQQRSQRLPTPAGRDSAFFATARSGTRWHWAVTEELFRRLRKHAGVDINTIRGWLGHVSLDTTHVYAEVDLEMKAKALAHCDVPQRSHAKQWHLDTSIIGFLRAL